MSSLTARKRWVVVGTSAVFGMGAPIAIAAFGGIELNDRADAMGTAIVVPAEVQIPVAATTDLSPESADSPNASPFDSVNSPFDSPGDPGYVDPSPESADSPNASAADSPAPAPVPAPPAPAPAPPPPPADQGGDDSAASAGGTGGASTWSGTSTGGDDSAASGGSAGSAG